MAYSDLDSKAANEMETWNSRNSQDVPMIQPNLSEACDDPSLAGAAPGFEATTAQRSSHKFATELDYPVQRSGAALVPPIFSTLLRPSPRPPACNSVQGGHGIAGIYGNYGNVESASYRI